AHALVLAAVALVVLRRAEDLRAEEPVPLGLEGAGVDGLGLLHLAVRPRPDLVRRGERNPDGVEGKRALRLLEETEAAVHHIVFYSGRASVSWMSSARPCSSSPMT